MISPASQVLQRHPHFFQHRSVLFAGNVNDDFPWQSEAKESKIWSCYFDYVHLWEKQSAVHFGIEFTGGADLLVFYWTKNKHESAFLLQQLLTKSPLGQTLLIVGENRSGVRAVENLLAPYGEIAKIDSARRCSLYHFSLQKPPHFSLQAHWSCYALTDSALNIYALPGVFSAKELDVGTRLLLSTLQPKQTGRVLDLGCGAGVIGCSIKKLSPQVTLTMTDIHAMAIASAQRTLQENHLTGEVFPSDVFSHIADKFDLIISNPPFHDGIDTTYHMVQKLISESKAHLNPGGELRIVANAFLPYAQWLDQHFGTHQVLAQSNKFKVYSAKK